jgi:polygalacturonase
MVASSRSFRRIASIAPLLAIAVVLSGQAPQTTSRPIEKAPASDPWAEVPAILARIVPPTFPKREFPITRFGAVAGGTQDAGPAFRKAIEACSRAGGGRVIVPAGTFVTGAIRLLSNVDLHISEGAVVRFSRDPAQYPVVLTRWEGMELMNYSPLIYALDQENIAITGTGTLDGQASAEHWWPWKAGTQRPDREQLFKQAEAGVPVEQRVYGPGHFLRPTFIEPYRCKNVLIEGVTVKDSPFWQIHPVLSKNVTVRGVKISGHGPNTDGCDPESCEDVLIEDTEFDTGDDCIALKSGRNADGRRVNVPVKNVIVRGCRMKAGHGGVTIGSEISGGARGIFIERCVMSSPQLERGLRIKTNAMRGGVVEDVFMRDVQIGEVRDGAVDIDMLYEEGDAGSFLPTVRNIQVERLTVEKAGYALFVRALERSPVRGLRVRDSIFRGVQKGTLLDGVRGLLMENVTLESAAKP